MSSIEYMGYIAKIEYDADMGMYCGVVINATPNTFYGESVDVLEEEFACTMEEYFKFCHEKGIQPKKPTSVKFNIKTIPELQR